MSNIDEFNDKFDTSLLKMDSCGLLVAHGAFQAGHEAAQWKINGALRRIFKLFPDSHAHSAYYNQIAGSDLFSTTFCFVRFVRWV